MPNNQKNNKSLGFYFLIESRHETMLSFRYGQALAFVKESQKIVPRQTQHSCDLAK